MAAIRRFHHTSPYKAICCHTIANPYSRVLVCHTYAVWCAMVASGGIGEPTELQETQALSRWLTEHGIAHLHVPNEGARSPAMGGQLKRAGLSAGIPDMLILSQTAQCPHGCWVELKRRSGGRVSPAQRAWHRRLADLGWPGLVAYGAREAVRWLRSHGYGAGVSGAYTGGQNAT